MDAWREKLRAYIEKEGLKKEAVAAKIGVSRATLSSWLYGRSYPRPSHIQRIVEVIPDIAYSDFGAQVPVVDEIADIVEILLEHAHLLKNGMKEKLLERIRMNSSSKKSLTQLVKDAIDTVLTEDVFSTQNQTYNRGIDRKEVRG